VFPARDDPEGEPIAAPLTKSIDHEFAGRNLVVEAVWREPVSPSEFPDIRRNTGNFVNLSPDRNSSAKKSIRDSAACPRIP
jgi:hypothetical protein